MKCLHSVSSSPLIFVSRDPPGEPQTQCHLVLHLYCTLNRCDFISEICSEICGTNLGLKLGNWIDSATRPQADTTLATLQTGFAAAQRRRNAFLSCVATSHTQAGCRQADTCPRAPPSCAHTAALPACVSTSRPQAGSHVSAGSAAMASSSVSRSGARPLRTTMPPR